MKRRNWLLGCALLSASACASTAEDSCPAIACDDTWSVVIEAPPPSAMPTSMRLLIQADEEKITFVCDRYASAAAWDCERRGGYGGAAFDDDGFVRLQFGGDGYAIPDDVHIEVRVGELPYLEGSFTPTPPAEADQDSSCPSCVEYDEDWLGA